MDEKQKFISLVNSSQEAMTGIAVKESEIAGSQKWEARLTKYFHSPKIRGLFSLIGRFFVFDIWFSVGVTLAIIIDIPIATLIPVSEFNIICIVVLICILWIGPVYVLPVVFNLRTKKLQKELAVLQQDPALGWLPPQYRTSFCYGKLCEYIQFDRAESTKEAFDLLQREIDSLANQVNSAIVSAMMSM